MKKEIFLNTLFTLLVSVLMFVQNKFFIKYLGIDNFGILKLFTQMLQYLNIVEIGIGGAASYALYEPLLNKNYLKVSIIINTMEKIYNKIAVIILCLGIFASFLLPFFIDKKSFNNYIYLYWILFLINTVISYFFVKYSILFSANQEFLFVRYVRVGCKVFYQIIQLLFLFVYSSFQIYIILLILDNITQFIFFKRHFKKKYKFVVKTNEKYPNLIENLKYLFWHRIANMVVYNTDLIIISKIENLEVVGIYASYLVILQLFKVFSQTIIDVLRPKIGKYIVENTKEKTYEYFLIINVLFFSGALFISITSIYLMNSFIKLWIGKNYILSTMAVILICFNGFVLIFKGVIEVFKECFGFFDDIQTPILEVLINLFLSLVLGVKFGILGIIFGTVISNLLIILFYKPFLVFKRCFKKNAIEYIKNYGNYMIIFLISSFVIFNCVEFSTEVKGWFDWLETAILTSLKNMILITLIMNIFNKKFRAIFLKVAKLFYN